MTPEELAPYKAWDEKFRCNGNTLYRTNPEKYGRIASLLSEGVPIGRIANLLGTSPHMVRAVQVREGASIATNKQYVADMLMTTAMVGAEKLLEHVCNDEIPAATLPIALGIIIDKMQTLSGDPTQIVQVKKEMTVSEFNDMIKDLPRAQDATDTTAAPHLSEPSSA
tara:strand:- start:37 stop:537 length:501 start_codon:yes stop_codon:yes gene_type:complete